MIAEQLTRSGYVLTPAQGHPTAQKSGLALKHRKVWWDSVGPIPTGHVIHHKNGDKTDNRLANLECVSRRGHMLCVEHKGENERRLSRHRHHGTAALNRLNSERGPWNTGTTEHVNTQCDVCEQVFTREAREVRKSRKRGFRVTCSRKCSASRKHSTKARGEV